MPIESDILLPDSSRLRTETVNIGGISRKQQVGTMADADGNLVTSSAAGTKRALDVVESGPASAIRSTVASSTSSTPLLAVNAARRGASIKNDSTATLYLAFGATASSAAFDLDMAPGSFYELPTPAYTGVINGAWSAVNGQARVVELT